MKYICIEDYTSKYGQVEVCFKKGEYYIISNRMTDSKRKFRSRIGSFIHIGNIECRIPQDKLYKHFKLVDEYRNEQINNILND